MLELCLNANFKNLLVPNKLTIAYQNNSIREFHLSLSMILHNYRSAGRWQLGLSYESGIDHFRLAVDAPTVVPGRILDQLPRPSILKAIYTKSLQLRFSLHCTYVFPLPGKLFKNIIFNSS